MALGLVTLVQKVATCRILTCRCIYNTSNWPPSCQSQSGQFAGFSPVVVYITPQTGHLAALTCRLLSCVQLQGQRKTSLNNALSHCRSAFRVLFGRCLQPGKSQMKQQAFCLCLGICLFRLDCKITDSPTDRSSRVCHAQSAGCFDCADQNIDCSMGS